MSGIRPPTGELPRGILFQFGAYYLKFKDGRGQWVRKVCNAQTVGEAKVLLRDLEAQASRQRNGLEPLPGVSTMSLAQAASWWLANECPERSHEREELRLGKHVIRNPKLGTVGAARLTGDQLDLYFTEMAKMGAAPSSINRLRTSVHSVFAAMKKAKPPLFVGPNPVADTAPRRVPKRKHTTLEPEEIELVLAATEDPMWRYFSATAVYSAMRKGELCGLLKTSVDLRHRELLVAVSYDHDTTKGNKAVSLPIADVLVPYLEQAIALHPKSKFVFSHADGKMLTEHANPEKILRTALKRAGLITGFEHWCRRCGHSRRPRPGAEALPSPFKRYRETFADGEQRRCPQCQGKLWAEPVPIDMVFHDLRHSTATILIRKGTPLPIVQALLRHANINTTIGTYVHVVGQDMRDAVNNIAPKSAPLSPPPAAPPPPGATRDELYAQATALLAKALGHAEAVELLSRALGLPTPPPSPPAPAKPDGHGQPVVSHLKVIK